MDLLIFLFTTMILFYLMVQSIFVIHYHSRRNRINKNFKDFNHKEKSILNFLFKSFLNDQINKKDCSLKEEIQDKFKISEDQYQSFIDKLLKLNLVELKKDSENNKNPIVCFNRKKILQII